MPENIEEILIDKIDEWSGPFKIDLTKYKDPDSLEWFIENKWEPYEMGDPEKVHEKYLIKKYDKKDRKFIFITIQDFKTRLKDIEKCKLFIQDISPLYECGQWVIESGKNQEDFNIHFHLLVKINKHVKNHKRDINVAWKRYFDTDLNDNDYYLMKQWRKSKKMPSYETWILEKKEYFNNETKSDEHKNVIDLGLSGEF